MKYVKYHGLGNDYIILSPDEASASLNPVFVRWICDRHYGIGSDGVLLGPLPSDCCDYRLRLYNPDGGEFEKSGNGLRIFARYLWDCGLAGEEEFSLQTPGGNIRCSVLSGGQNVRVEMGRVNFSSKEIPVLGPDREIVHESIQVGGAAFSICAATIGNPHCVVLCDEISQEQTLRWGPEIEILPIFPNRTNVQFMKVLDWENIQIEIWERGAGYTLASGSSSCASAAAAHRLGLCGANIQVHSPGGVLEVSLNENYEATLLGPVTKVCEGVACVGEAFDAYR